MNKQSSLPVSVEPESNWTHLLPYLSALSSDGQLVSSDSGIASCQRNLPTGATAYGIPCMRKQDTTVQQVQRHTVFPVCVSKTQQS